MKRICSAVVLVFLVHAIAQAQLKVIGEGENLRVDTSGFPPQMQQAYGLMTQKCSQCHTIERIIVSVMTGVTPVTRGEFSKETTTAIVKRMYLKSTANLTRKEVREIILLLNYMLDSKQSALSDSEQAPKNGDIEKLRENDDGRSEIHQ